MSIQFLRCLMIALLSMAVMTLCTYQAHCQVITTPVPSKDEQDKAFQNIKLAHREDYRAVADGKANAKKLAAKLLAEAMEKKENNADRYVRLEQARLLACKAGDLDIAMQAVGEMSVAYDLNGHQLILATLSSVANSVEKKDEAEELTNDLLRRMNDSANKEDYVSAMQFAEIAAVAARRTKYLPLVLNVRRENRRIAAARKQFSDLEPILAKLKQTPDDPEANFLMGRYLCLLKGEWERGLYLLAQCKQEGFRLAAQRDLAGTDNHRLQVDLGNDWWDLAAKMSGPEQVRLRQRAVYWYEQALYRLEGDEKIKIEKRIAETPPSMRTSAPWDFQGKPGEIKRIALENGSIFGVAYAPDGKTILSGNTSSQATLYNAESGKVLHRLTGHQSLLWSVTYGPKSKNVFTASWDGTIKMWDVATGKEVRRFPSNGRISDVNGIAISPDGTKLMAGADDSAVHIWDINNGKEILNMRGHSGFVYGVAFTPDGLRAVSGGSQDGTLIFWDLKAGKEIRRIRGLAGSIRTVSISPDGKYVVAAGDTTIRMWDLKTGKMVRQFQGHTAPVQAVAFSPDGRRMASGGEDATIRYWDVRTGREIMVFRGHTAVVSSLAFSPGGGRLVSGSSGDNTIRTWGLPR